MCCTSVFTSFWHVCVLWLGVYWWKRDVRATHNVTSERHTTWCQICPTKDKISLHGSFTRMRILPRAYRNTIKTRIILLLTRITSFHIYVLERYDICMVRCDAQSEWHVTGSALSWRIVLSRCDVITIMLWQSFTVDVVLKVISVGTPAIRHIHVNIVEPDRAQMTTWLMLIA